MRLSGRARDRLLGFAIGLVIWLVVAFVLSGCISDTLIVREKQSQTIIHRELVVVQGQRPSGMPWRQIEEP